MKRNREQRQRLGGEFKNSTRSKRQQSQNDVIGVCSGFKSRTLCSGCDSLFVFNQLTRAIEEIVSEISTRYIVRIRVIASGVSSSCCACGVHSKTVREN